MIDRRHFLGSLASVAAAALRPAAKVEEQGADAPRAADEAADEPDSGLYLVQVFRALAGADCALSWDGKNRWRADCRGQSRPYVHPRPWHAVDHKGDAEFYRMQQAAQDMAWDLLYEMRCAA